MSDSHIEDQKIALPSFRDCTYSRSLSLPSRWKCTALLHPFSPPPSSDPQPSSPFYQLCLANIAYVENEKMSIQVIGETYGTWWYMISPSGTKLSTDEGGTWQTVEMGWSLPSVRWLTNSSCVGNAYLNWMEAQRVDWWKTPVSQTNAATWYWINTEGSSKGMPLRMMFGAPPKQPTLGDPTQLAFFQMYSFSYLVDYSLKSVEIPNKWQEPRINGFSFGNEKNYKKVIRNSCFGMTAFMTPVDIKSNPLPTRVLYKWEEDSHYKVLADRAQNTLMQYSYNRNSDLVSEEALMFGITPDGISIPNSGSSFLIDTKKNGDKTCKRMPLGQEPPNWTSIPGVQGRIHACISNNPELCPHENVMIMSVTFPPTDEYPQGRYLWTWYSPFSGSDGVHSRPVTFMESASNIVEGGTSLALADYYDYQEYKELPITSFLLPSICANK